MSRGGPRPQGEGHQIGFLGQSSPYRTQLRVQTWADHAASFHLPVTVRCHLCAIRLVPRRRWSSKQPAETRRACDRTRRCRDSSLSISDGLHKNGHDVKRLIQSAYCSTRYHCQNAFRQSTRTKMAKTTAVNGKNVICGYPWKPPTSMSPVHFPISLGTAKDHLQDKSCRH